MNTISNHEMQTPQDRPSSALGGLGAIGLIMLLAGACAFAQIPSVQILSPGTGAAFTVGSTLTVQWKIDSQTQPDGGVAVLFSPDEGMSWLYLSKNTIQNGDTTIYRDSIGTFSCIIADSVRMYGTVYVQMASAQCLVKVEAPYDDSFVPGTSNIFSISPSTHVVRSSRNDIGNHRPAYEIRRVNGFIKTSEFGIVRLDGRRLPPSVERLSKGFNH